MFKTVKYGQNSFRYHGSHLLNSLPPIMKRKSDIKSMIKEWAGPECACSYCKLCSLYTM